MHICCGAQMYFFQFSDNNAWMASEPASDLPYNKMTDSGYLINTNSEHKGNLANA